MCETALAATSFSASHVETTTAAASHPFSPAVAWSQNANIMFASALKI
jgi:hypothetical protein